MCTVSGTETFTQREDIMKQWQEIYDSGQVAVKRPEIFGDLLRCGFARCFQRI